MIEVFDMPQGSPEWYEARLGTPTASNFQKVMAGGEGKTRTEYLYKLAGEIMSGLPREEYRSAAMERGSQMEPDIRAHYSMLYDVQPEPVGFVKHTKPWGVIGASPDSFVGSDIAVEYKSQAPHVLIATMKAGRVPPEFMPQIQGTLLVTGRAACDLVVGYSGMPLFRRRITRSSDYIARLEVALESFCGDLTELVKWIRNYRD